MSPAERVEALLRAIEKRTREADDAITDAYASATSRVGSAEPDDHMDALVKLRCVRLTVDELRQALAKAGGAQ